MFQDHLQRIREGADSVYKLHNLSGYVEKYIRLDGKAYKFGDRYGFQRTIIDDASRVTNTVKPAQIGLTTSTMAYVLAGAATQPKFNIIYALPSAGDAQKLVTTKMNPLIADSPEISRILDVNINSNELKKIGRNFLFMRGTKSETAALSISADALVADEVDRCDPDVMKQFRSRLQASDLQIIKQFSTPTMNGVGIDKEAKTSRRYRHFATCACCNLTWLPSYHTDIVIPDYDHDLKDINKENIKDIKWQQARWKCPSCGKDPNLHPSRLQWVAENLQDNYEANTYYVSPVTACLVLLPSYLVRTSTEFNTRAEWQNQVLGETAENSNEQITETDVAAAIIPADLNSSNVHVMGCDMGLLCAVTIGREDQEGNLLVVHREMVPINNFMARRAQLIQQYRVIASCHDVYPYTNTIMQITEADPNAYGVVTIRTKSPEMYTLKEKLEDADEGKLNLRLLSVNRVVWLDKILELFKERKVLIKEQAQNFNGHYISMKRTQIFADDSLVYEWQKTDGEDHMLFSLGFLYLAAKMRSRATWASVGNVPFVSKFRVKS